VVIKPRNYDTDFYAAVMGTPVDAEKVKSSLGGGSKRRI
jgi:hypothetical protein